MIDLHSFLLSVHTGSGYLTFADIVECNAAHVSDYDICPLLDLAPHSIVTFFNSVIIFDLFPSGANQTPSI